MIVEKVFNHSEIETRVNKDGANVRFDHVREALAVLVEHELHGSRVLRLKPTLGGSLVNTQ